MKKESRIKIISTTIIVCAFIVLAVLLFSGCGNRQVFDSTFTFNKAVINMPDGDVIKGNIQSWRDFEDGDMIQVKIDGRTYLTHSSNVVLIAD